MKIMFSMLQITNILQVIGLFPIVGGTVVLGALVAPIAFGNLAKKDAAKLVTLSFCQFNDWLKIAAAMLLGGKLIDLIFISKFSFTTKTIVENKEVASLDMWALVSLVLVAAIAGISYHIAFNLSPQIIGAYRKSVEKQSRKFNQLHKESENLHRINFLCALILLLSFAV